AMRARPAQVLHFGLVLRAVRPAAVVDIEDAGGVHDRRQQLALVMEAWVLRVHAQELAADLGPPAGAAIVALEPAEHLPGALEAGRVDELVQDLAVDPHRTGAASGCRSGPLVV